MKNVGVIFGGQSGEHEVSLMSAVNLINSIDKKNYNVSPILITKDGKWLLHETVEQQISNVTELHIKKEIQISDLPRIIDAAFPVIHGETGEDGKLQGLLDMLNIEYVGCNLETSAIGMNKHLTKELLKPYIPVVEGISLKKNDVNEKLIEEIEKTIGYPLFIKPVRAGSSLGANKANDRKELLENIEKAFLVDKEVLVEKFVKMIELEVAVFEDSQGQLHVSDVGHIDYTSEFYDYESKYIGESSKMIIPAKVAGFVIERIKEYAIAVTNILGVRDYSRIDFFYNQENKNIYFNEINTSPGMTNKSMYPFLFKSQFEFEYIVEELLKKQFDK